MDETAFNYNMNSKATKHKIGAKTIMIKTQNQEKLRISAIMSIWGNGERLKPYLIFKGAHNGRTHHSLSKLNEVNKSLVVINVNNNAWATKNIIKDWIQKIYIPYFNGTDLSKTLLIWDNASMNNSFEILKFLNDKKINIIFVPRGLTPILHPLDLSINRPLKDWVKKKYEECIQNIKFKKPPKIKREILLNWILNMWDDKNKITTEVIKNSFLYCGITNKLDGTEDEMFVGYEKINEIGIIENDFSKEDAEDENNDISIGESEDSEDNSSDLEIENEENNKKNRK